MLDCVRSPGRLAILHVWWCWNMRQGRAQHVLLIDLAIFINSLVWLFYSGSRDFYDWIMTWMTWMNFEGTIGHI